MKLKNVLNKIKLVIPSESLAIVKFKPVKRDKTLIII